MLKAGVPVIPGSDGIIKDISSAKKLLKIGYPVMLKAQLEEGKRYACCATRIRASKFMGKCKNEAKASFGNDGMYMEKLVVEPRHIEIQIIGVLKESLSLI